MKIFKEILGRIFALWAITCFVLMLLIFFIPVLITGLWPEPKRTRLLLKVIRFWMMFYLFIIGFRIKVRGAEHFKKGVSYIVVCNHNSMLDVPISTTAIPGTSKTIAKIEMSLIPIFGTIYKRGSVLVDRKNEESRKESYNKMKKVLNMGMHMCIYPEGTRNKTNQPLQRFHDGAFRLAEESGHPILPAVIFNTSKALPANKTLYYWPAKTEIHFLQPVEPGSRMAHELKEIVFHSMQNHFTQTSIKNW